MFHMLGGLPCPAAGLLAMACGTGHARHPKEVAPNGRDHRLHLWGNVSSMHKPAPSHLILPCGEEKG